MQDTRAVKLLIHNGQGEFFVLKRDGVASADALDLPGGQVAPGEEDILALDRELARTTGLVLNTEDAIHVGYDAEYEPGEGMMTRVLYMLKIETPRPRIELSDEHNGFDWVDKATLRGFLPPYQILVSTALDFYL